jgi:hypothetical protein
MKDCVCFSFNDQKNFECVRKANRTYTHAYEMHIHVYIQADILSHTHTTHAHAHEHAHGHKQVRTQIHTHIHTHPRTCINPHTRACMHAHTHARTHTHTHTHKHTNTHRSLSGSPACNTTLPFSQPATPQSTRRRCRRRRPHTPRRPCASRRRRVRLPLHVLANARTIAFVAVPGSCRWGSTVSAGPGTNGGRRHAHPARNSSDGGVEGDGGGHVARGGARHRSRRSRTIDGLRPRRGQRRGCESSGQQGRPRPRRVSGHGHWHPAASRRCRRCCRRRLGRRRGVQSAQPGPAVMALTGQERKAPGRTG